MLPVPPESPIALRAAEGAPAGRVVPARYIRPHGASDIRGLAWWGPDLVTLDTRSGRIALVDPGNDDTRVLNDAWAAGAVGARGLALAGSGAWFTTSAGLHRAAWAADGAPTLADPVLVRPGRCDAVAIWGDEAYLVEGDTLQVLDLDEVGDRTPARRTVPLHGVGAKGITATEGALWLSDDVEQTVYCLDRHTLETRFRVVTPLEGPTALAARAGGEAGAVADEVHVAYHEHEPFLKDDPWSDPAWVVRYRHRALVHALHVLHDPGTRRAWSTGHRIKMSYVVDLEPDDDLADHLSGATTGFDDVEWRIALPLDTTRQRLVSVEPIGLPFTIEMHDDLEGVPQPVALFRIPRLERSSRLVLGWRATLEVFGIKHLIRAEDVIGPVDADTAARYLVDDEDLDLESPEVAAAAAAAVGDERNPVRAARRIRSHVYDLLEYEMGNADSPVAVMARGTGSCGEYVGTIMALLRRAGLACRVAGRYKCPYQPWTAGPLYPDYNHVWVDLHLPGHGWVPVESNPDDVVDGGPYPDRFFLGLPWRHVELGKDISFERVTYDPGPHARRRRRIGARRLSRNTIRFEVLSELAPVGPASGPGSQDPVMGQAARSTVAPVSRAATVTPSSAEG